MEEYKPNSHRFREGDQNSLTEKNIDKVVVGPVKSRKKNKVRKLADVFISDDIENVKDYILMDILVPEIKKAISDIVTNGVNMLLYPDGKKNHKSSKVSYRSYYDRERQRRSARSGPAYNYDDIILDSRGEAEDVLLRMDEIISKYGVASVGDLYDLVGIDGNFTDNKYGWTDIRNARAVRIKEGYLLKMPRAMPLD